MSQSAPALADDRRDVGEISDAEVLARFPYVLIDHDNKYHYKGLLTRRLLVNRCGDCGYWIYPHRPMCPECWSENIVPTEVSGKGTVYTFTLLHQGRAIPGVDYAKGPHPVVAIELAEQEGLRYLSTVVTGTPEEIYIGMPVELDWVERQGAPAVVFRPATPSSGTSNSVSGADPGEDGR